MAVGDDDAAQLVLVLQHIRVIRKDEVYARLLVVGKHEASIYENHIVPVFKCRHVLADTIKTAQGNDPERGLRTCHAKRNPFKCYVLS